MMLKNTFKDNENIKVNSREVTKMKSVFPQFFDNQGNFRFEQFEEMLKESEVDLNKEGYGLDFLGKSYAKYELSLETETVITPDTEHNKLEENNQSENMYIVGDNIDALKHLLKSYANKIRCIYIDPPYNTGSDGFVYPDSFKFSAEELVVNLGIEEREAQRILDLNGKSTHSAWMTFMYPRLMLARDLLTDDGVIFISIDDNEQANLKLICDEIFGEENFLSNLIVQSNKRGQTYKEIAKTHEYILVYSKSDIASINQVDGNTVFKMKDNNGGFSERELRNRNPKFGRFNRPNLYYPIYVDPETQDANGYHPISIEKTDTFSIEVLPLNSKNEESCWRWGKKKVKDNNIKSTMENDVVARRKNTGEFGIYEKYRNPKVTIKSIWFNDDLYLENGSLLDDTDYITEKGSIELRSLELGDAFPFPKPVSLIEKCIELATNPGEQDIVLDFFSGSATAAHSVIRKNSQDNGKRKYIMVQLPEKIGDNEPAYQDNFKTIDEIGRERIVRAAEKIKKESNSNIDYGFKLYRLNNPTQATINDIIDFDPKDYRLFDTDFIKPFAFDGEAGEVTILKTWLNKDGYGLLAEAEPYKLDTYMANRYDNSLYIIETGLKSRDVMELIRRLEINELQINRVVIYAYSLGFDIMHELKTNLANLKNNQSVSLIERY